MIGFLARCAVFVELVLLTWLAWSEWAGGASPLRIFAVPILVAVGWRSLVVLGPFTLVLIHRLRDGLPIDAGHFLQAIRGEWMAKSLSFGLYQPFESWLLGPEPGAAIDAKLAHRPVLLIHGYLCNRGSWFGVRRLIQQTWPGPVHTISLEPPFGSIDDYVPQVSAKVEQILRQTGADKVHLVCHSMGGLVARAWLRQSGAVARTASLTTLGSPHHGTRLAGWGIGKNVGQMNIGSAWLAQLAADESGFRPPFSTLCIVSEQDNLVYPPQSGELPWATSIRLHGVGHVALQSSPAVAALVLEQLQQAGE